ncbi:Endoglucanase EG-II [Cadophora sp. M221]|nr:Endoglucanase EG-II [Cadophora sp. M221]
MKLSTFAGVAIAVVSLGPEQQPVRQDGLANMGMNITISVSLEATLLLVIYFKDGQYPINLDIIFLYETSNFLRDRNTQRLSNRKTGVNIAGFDFGCLTDGSQNTANVYPPLSSLGGPDGIGQMTHFIKDDHMNIFRLPVGWQFLVANNLGGTLDASNFAKYDQLVQGCLATGASCIIDIHNYARWNGGVIGQGGPTDAQFASLWTQLAVKYKGNAKIIFGLMNEPHDVDINRWATTVQVVVAAIRNAGATSQMLLLPGNEWTSAGSFVSNGSGAALMKVTNPDGSTTGLIFDVHKYLDNDNSGTHSECVTDNVSGAFQPLATWLRANKRQAMLTETGGGNVASCTQYMCKQVAFLNANSDVYLAYVGWGAGSFDSTYILTETPNGGGSNWQDTLLVKSCLAR